jgi:hypothetical protein
MDIFKLYRYFWDFAFSNPELIKPNHCAVYSFAIEHCNRLGWKEKFGFPSSMAMEATGIKSYSVYKKTFDDLVEYDFFTVIQYSKNQYSSNIIALKENNKAHSKALDKAMIKHVTKQDESICSIDKQETNKQETINKFIIPTILEISEYCKERNNKVDAERFFNHYESNGWIVGKVKMKSWKAAVRTWEKNNFDIEKKNEFKGM